MLTNPFNTLFKIRLGRGDPFKDSFMGDYTVVVGDSARFNQARTIIVIGFATLH